MVRFYELTLFHSPLCESRQGGTQLRSDFRPSLFLRIPFQASTRLQQSHKSENWWLCLQRLLWRRVSRLATDRKKENDY